MCQAKEKGADAPGQGKGGGRARQWMRRLTHQSIVKEVDTQDHGQEGKCAGLGTTRWMLRDGDKEANTPVWGQGGEHK